MPELPEVRTVVKYLNENVKGKTISDIKIFYTKLLKNISVDNFKNELKNQTIENVLAYGKYIIFELSNNEMISHLRMEGKWIYEEQEFFTYGEKILEAQFSFKNDTKVLRYYDSRRFGTLDVTPKNQWKTLKGIAKLGYEPFDKRATPDYLYNKLQKTSRPIKTVLLDQTILLGIGNIYADEILFDSKIHPLKPANEITKNQAAKILDSSIRILKSAIVSGGTTIRSFKSGDNHTGNFQNFLKVHGKVSKNKDFPIVKIKVNGRGTYFNPLVQKI